LLGDTGALAGGGAAHGVVTLIRRVAGDGIGSRAHSRFARRGPRARVAVVARGAVELPGIRACAGGGVAGARVVALVERRAHHRTRSLADPARAGAGSGAWVGACAAVGLGGIGTLPRRRVAGAAGVALIGRRAGGRSSRRAGAAVAGVAGGAGVPVLARCPF